MLMGDQVLSVSHLIQTIKLTLDQNALLRSFYVKGEVSNFTAHHNGHWYFSLKDDQARIQCVMFQTYTKQVAFRPKEGAKVLLRAALSVYPVQGQLQCTVFSMESDGVGDLYLRFEALKKRLHAEGLFEDRHKKRLPAYPVNVGVISGRNSAALQDILETFRKRWPLARVTVYPSLVQGDQAPQQLITQLKQADAAGHEVIILARGGGSIEDLWAFNDESLARAIFAASTPLVSGVGHETDTTIADMVADYRAPTPTGAVQAIIKDMGEVRLNLKYLRRIMHERIHQRIRLYAQSINHIKERSVLKEPTTLILPQRLHLVNAQQALLNQRSVVDQLRNRLIQSSSKLQHAQDLRLQTLKQHFAQLLKLLQAFSPVANLQRGYSVVTNGDRVVHSIQDVSINDTLNIYVADGQIQATVNQKGNSHEPETEF
jgi:exodeoxyribonuclease VII large subunit